MELYIFDKEMNRIGVVDNYISLKIEKNYRKMSYLELAVGADETLIELIRRGNILAKGDEIDAGYIIETVEYTDEGATEFYVKAPSLSSILGRRIVQGQQEFTGSVENVMKSFVMTNATNPVNPNRKISNLTISPNSLVAVETVEGTANKNLSEFLFELANKHDVSWDVKMNITNKNFVFRVWQGEDRSTLQSSNPYVIFSKEFENVLNQSYVNSESNYRNTAIVAGEDVEDRVYVNVNDEAAGLDRYELFVDANSIKKKYKNDNGVEVTLNDIQYRELLSQYGDGKLYEKTLIETFESEVDPFSQFHYNVDYFLGDKVSIRNPELGISLHTRIVSIKEEYNRGGFDLSIDFGENVPTLVEKIKGMVN